MKKLALVSVCVLSFALAGSAATSNSMIGQTPVKKEAPATKKCTKKSSAKKMGMKKCVKKNDKAPAPKN